MSGGGGGGYSGGGGGAATWTTNWTGPNPNTYDGAYHVGATGGGGSSFTNGTFTNLTVVSDPRDIPADGSGNHG